jgi:hypothetical protein
LPLATESGGDTVARIPGVIGVSAKEKEVRWEEEDMKSC